MSKKDEILALNKAYREMIWRHLSPAEPSLVTGDGDCDKSRIVMIGEAPGETEVQLGKPFVGKAGQNLDQFLALAALSRDDFYLTNTVKLRPTELGSTGRTRYRAPTPDEIDLFLPWLMDEIKIIAPDCIVTLGNTPLKSLLGPQAGIGRLHGRWQELVLADGEGQTTRIPLFPMYHPAALIYKPDLADSYRRDVETFGKACRENHYQDDFSAP